MLEGAINFLGRTWGNLFHSWRKNTEIELCKEHWDRTLHQFDNPFGFNNWTFACLLFVPVTTVVVPLAARSLTAGSPPRGMRVEFWLWRIQCLPGFGKNPWGREWQPIPVFLPGKRHGQRSLAGYSSQGHKRIRRDLATKQQQQQLCIIQETRGLPRSATSGESLVLHPPLQWYPGAANYKMPW